jgi:DHA1 family bicyclomycin/chloramphenicol resistance-like MFS transporter/DHA1 family 2-module integral membrane pump EmrD-like MFS transporter
MNSRSHIVLLTIILLVATLMQICTDIYTPSLPAIAHNLNTTLGQVQLTMTYFMAGVAITNLLYGPLSEGIGRRKTLLIGISIAIVGTLVCIGAHHITQLQIGRLIQGAGLGACSALWRSIFRDAFQGKELVRLSSYLVNYIVLALIAAPFLGGYLQQYLGWHATFIFLLCWISLVFLVVLFTFKETSQHHGHHRLNLRFMLRSYIELIQNRTFIGFSCIVFCSYGGLFSWMTAGPVLLIHGVGLSPVMFGYLMIFSGLTVAASGIINGKLSKRVPPQKVVTYALASMCLAGMALLVSYYFFGLTLYVILIPGLLFLFSANFIFMNCFALAFENVGHIAGYAGSLYACLQLLGGAVFSAILSHLNTQSPVPMACMFLASGAGAWILFSVVNKKTG